MMYPDSRDGVVALLLLSLASGCSDDDLGDDPTADDAFGMFMERAHVLDDGHLVIDGDVIVRSIDEARAYFDLGHPTASDSEFRLTMTTVDGEDSELTYEEHTHFKYCVDEPSFGADAPAVIAAAQAAANSWMQVANVYFERIDVTTCDNSNNDVHFNIRWDPNWLFFYAAAFFPHYPRADREVRITDSGLDANTNGLDLDGILRHEFGHTLGFRHEHVWIVCTGETPVSGDIDARPLTDYDDMSVMHYRDCSPVTDAPLRQTELDHDGAVSVYGLNPSLLVATTTM